MKLSDLVLTALSRIYAPELATTEAEALQRYAAKLAATRDLKGLLAEIVRNERDSTSEEKSAEEGLEYPDLVSALYMGILGRAPDEVGFESHLVAWQRRIPLTTIIRDMISSKEFQSHQQSALVNPIVLPDLTKLYPEMYVRTEADRSILRVSSDDDFRLIQRWPRFFGQEIGSA